jgi:hypothetical protein
VEGRQSKVDAGGPAGPLVELGQLLLSASKGDFQALDFPEPTFPLGFGDTGQQVLPDLGDPAPLCRFRPQKAAP